MKRHRISAVFLCSAILSTIFLPSNIQWVKERLEERLPDTFGLDRIALHMEGEETSIAMPKLPISEGEVFRYLGHGGQAVAFASEDGKYILKFFLRRQLHGEKRFPIPKPTHWIPSHRKKRQEKMEEARLKSLTKALHNYKVAFEKIPEKTGIIALHLFSSKGNLPKVCLLDQKGEKHLVDLNEASFVFQHRAELVLDKLSSFSSSEEKQAILSLLKDFFSERAKAGFIDIERSFMIEANYGFLGNQLIQLDVGNIEFIPELKTSPEEEIKRIHGMLQTWINEKNLI